MNEVMMQYHLISFLNPFLTAGTGSGALCPFPVASFAFLAFSINLNCKMFQVTFPVPTLGSIT